MYDLSWCFPGYYNGLLHTHYIKPSNFDIPIYFQIQKTNQIIINNNKIDVFA